MNIFRKLYFNKPVNRLNKNLKIKQKSYLAFFLVIIMIVIFSLYVLHTYSEIEKREVCSQKVYELNQNYLLLVLAIEQQNTTLFANVSEKNIEKEQIINLANQLKESILILKHEIVFSNLNLQRLLNQLNDIESVFKNGQIDNDSAGNTQFRTLINSRNQELLKYKDLFNDYYIQNSKLIDLTYSKLNWLIFILMSAGILGSVIIANFISYRITDPIKKLKDNIIILEQGNYDVDNKFEVLDNDEIGDIAKGIERIGQTIKETVIFTEKIGVNEFDADLNLNKSGKLASALLSMRDSLKAITEQNEIQKLQEEKRNWVVKGLADLGNILRSNYNDVETLYFQIIKEIINKIGANQGGIFIVQEKNGVQILKLSACYAYDRRKFINKEIEFGEGLVGQCAMEKQITNLTEIPNNYIQITSGLGKSNPKNLVLIPLILNNELYGVMELASFEIFDEHQIKYLEQSAESIASTVSNMQINLRTKALLEKTQMQSEEIASREEEMKQNMEELKATQEESERKADQLAQLLEESSMN